MVLLMALAKPVHMDAPIGLHVAQNVLRLSTASICSLFASERFWPAEFGAPEKITTTPNGELSACTLGRAVGLHSGWRFWFNTTLRLAFGSPGLGH